LSRLKERIEAIETSDKIEKKQTIDDIRVLIDGAGYRIVEQNEEKPWGAYFRLDGDQADMFVEEFFPGLSPTEARLGNGAAELSPKILLVSPAQRLSWQYHDRRAERWAFLTAGAYNKSQTDNPGEIIHASPGEVVQFAKGERHRLVGFADGYTLVAEIWQHTDADNLSNEEDIIRLEDDYQRHSV
jgi:mannose-6-phosphate isomerase